MANLPPNHNEFAPAAEAAPDNMNGWVEEEDPEMEEEEEDPEEDPEMEEEEEEMDADEEWDGPEWILPYQGADPLYPPPPTSDSESEIEFEEAEAEAEAEAEVAPIPPPVPANPEPEAVTVGTGRLTPLKRLFTDTQVWIGSSSSSTAASHDPEDLTPSHIRSDLDALHRRVRQIKNDDVRAENKRLRMMLDCSENRTRATWRELDRATWHYHNLRGWSIKGPYIAVRNAATAPATDNDDSPTHEETSPSKPQGSSPHDSYNFSFIVVSFIRITYLNLSIELMPLVCNICHFVNYATIIMPPKAMSQAAIERLITQRSMERISHKKTKNQVKSYKTGLGMEKCVKTKPNQSQVNSEKKSKENI
ncbi:hypothetical protein Tco_0458879 [Tanacetum coccineum]